MSREAFWVSVRRLWALRIDPGSGRCARWARTTKGPGDAGRTQVPHPSWDAARLGSSQGLQAALSLQLPVGTEGASSGVSLGISTLGSRLSVGTTFSVLGDQLCKRLWCSSLVGTPSGMPIVPA